MAGLMLIFGHCSSVSVENDGLVKGADMPYPQCFFRWSSMMPNVVASDSKTQGPAKIEPKATCSYTQFLK